MELSIEYTNYYKDDVELRTGKVTQIFLWLLENECHSLFFFVLSWNDVLFCFILFGDAGIRVVQVVAGPRMSLSCNDGFALALTDSGDVYSWGKGSKGRLGHNNAETIRSPKMIEALAAKNIKMVNNNNNNNMSKKKITFLSS